MKITPSHIASALLLSLYSACSFGQTDPIFKSRLKEVSYLSSDAQIKRLMDDPANKSLLKAGERFSVDKLKAERKRLTSYLQSQGVSLDATNVRVLVDTTVSRPDYLVFLSVKRPAHPVDQN